MKGTANGSICPFSFFFDKFLNYAIDRVIVFSIPYDLMMYTL